MMKNTVTKKSVASNLCLAILIAIPFTSCEDFVSIDPPKTEVVSEAVFSNDASALSAISGIYSLMMANTSFANTFVEIHTGTSSDELVSFSSSIADRQFYLNSLLPQNTVIQNTFWLEAYKYIFNANVAIEGLESSSSVTEKTKAQLIGEAKFIRALCFFYLTNLFGDVPLVTSSDYRVNSSMQRSAPEIVYAQIIDDLKAAQAQLQNDFGFTAGERVRPTKWAATALLARVYLYTGDWINAEAQATTVISNPTLFSLPTDLKNVFLRNSLETIFQLKPVLAGAAIRQTTLFVLTSAPTSAGKSLSLTNDLVTSMEAGDKRRVDWVGSVTSGSTTYYFPYKYKNVTTTPTEYNMVLRLAEQYLIRAEARAQQGNISGGLSDVNVIRNRAGLASRITLDKAELLSFIEKERRVELFTESGHRWFDLKRTGRATVVLQTIKPNWQDTDVLFPIPQTEINVNPALLPQNQGF